MKRNDLNITAVDFIAGAAVVGLLLVVVLWQWIDCRTSTCPEGMKPMLMNGQCGCVVRPAP